MSLIAAQVAPALTDLKAAPTADGTLLYDQAPFKWIQGDYSATSSSELDVNVIESDSYALSVGAWVRQSAAHVNAPEGNGQLALDARAVRSSTFQGIASASFAANVEQIKLDDGRTLLRDDTIDAASVSAFPTLNVLSADGKGWKLRPPRIVVGDTTIDVQLEYGVLGDGSNSSTAIQKAFDEAPKGCKLTFPPGHYLTTAPIAMTRQMDIYQKGGRLVSYLSDATRSALEIRIDDAVDQPSNGSATDCRGMVLDGLHLVAQNACRHALDVVHDTGQSTAVVANLLMHISGGYYGVPDGAAGYGIHFGGEVTQLHTINNGCQIVNGAWLDGCADGITFQNCECYGTKAAFLLELVEGAFCTRILDNVIVNRDGALIVRGASQVKFERNQVEQSGSYDANASVFQASVTIYPTKYRCRAIDIIENNFGGGEKVRRSIAIVGEPTVGGPHKNDAAVQDDDYFTAEDVFIDRNTFNRCAENFGGNPSTPNDILIPATGGNLVKWTRVGPNNRLRGDGAARGNVTLLYGPAIGANALDPGDLLSVADNGVGTYGVWKTGAAMTFQNGWRAGADFRFKKTFDDLVIFEGGWISGTTTLGTTIGVLPIGFRPKNDSYVNAMSIATPVVLKITAAGDVTIAGTIVPATADVKVTALQYRAKGRVGYNPGR